MTANAAIVGMLLGAITVVIWSNISGGIFDVYEILPGFLLASIGIVITTLLQPQAHSRTLAQYDSSRTLLLAG